MFLRCEKWLGEMQEVIWQGREWGRTANYVVPVQGQGQGGHQQQQHLAGVQVQVVVPQAPLGGPGVGEQGALLLEPEETDGEEMQEVLLSDTENGNGNELDQFQWPS